MIRFLLNEYRKWTTLEVLHLTISICVTILASVVFNEPMIMSASAIALAFTFFYIKIHSRLAYLMNSISVLLYGLMLINVGIIASGSAYLVVMFPASILITLYIYINRIYPEDYDNKISNGELMSNATSGIYLTAVAIIILGVGNYLSKNQLSHFPYIDISIFMAYLSSIVLVYFSKFEHIIAHVIADTLTVILWLLMFINYDIGISMLIVSLIVYGRSRLLLVWWVAKTFKVKLDGWKIVIESYKKDDKE